ncbi:agouti-related protein isoform X1 [Xiphophorus couchianus]|uniref:agouti-related protein isoform X1 n=1 Tax=Xiphophorus couchianus TaxID=32473 RepID=UPI00101637BE|nr:uncharacterized protein LOC114142537 isoform X1 [Xiphophorus couchianus]
MKQLWSHLSTSGSDSSSQTEPSLEPFLCWTGSVAEVLGDAPCWSCDLFLLIGFKSPSAPPETETQRPPQPEDRGHAPSPLQDGGLLPVDSEEDRLLMEAGSNNEDLSALQLQGRAVRSPRRCIPHQQFCLGYSLPCCDPCDTCYCRFYNAICYCRPVGHTCPQRPTRTREPPEPKTHLNQRPT